MGIVEVPGKISSVSSVIKTYFNLEFEMKLCVFF